MDAAILHDRLSAAEKALITIDERLDAQTDPSPVLAALAAQVATLQEQIDQCIATLTEMSNSSTSAEATIAEAEAIQAEAEAAEALAEAAEALAEAAILTATEEATETDGVTEIEPEPKPEPERSEAAPENKTGNWLERLLAVK